MFMDDEPMTDDGAATPAAPATEAEGEDAA